jgi:hypothetical protein
MISVAFIKILSQRVNFKEIINLTFELLKIINPDNTQNYFRVMKKKKKKHERKPFRRSIR